MKMDSIDYIKSLMEQGRKVGIFSCEDPLNAPFHRDVFNLGTYLHPHFTPAGIVELYTLDLGLSHKGIDAWGVFGHYGTVDGAKVCGAVNALLKGYENEGKDFKNYLDKLKERFPIDTGKSLKENVELLIKAEYDFLREEIRKKQEEFGLTRDIIVFGGIVYNLSRTKYSSKILFKDVISKG
jgi:hypothetical protein